MVDRVVAFVVPCVDVGTELFHEEFDRGEPSVGDVTVGVSGIALTVADARGCMDRIHGRPADGNGR